MVSLRPLGRFGAIRVPSVERTFSIVETSEAGFGCSGGPGGSLAISLPPLKRDFGHRGRGTRGRGTARHLTVFSAPASGGRRIPSHCSVPLPFLLTPPVCLLPPSSHSLHPVCEVGALLVRRLVIRFVLCACGESIASQYIRKTKQVTVLPASRKPNPERYALCFVALFAFSPSGVSGLRGEKHRIEEFLIMRIHFKVSAFWPMGPYVELMG